MNANTPKTIENGPKTLLEAVKYFADEDRALSFVVALHPGWENGPVCPRCASDKVGFLQTRRLWKCKACAKQFSAKVGTIFEDSPISLTKWLPAMWQIVNCKNGISSYELARAIGVTQKTAWFMLSRLRLAMQSDTDKFDGHVEVDETFIGGQARFMHYKKRQRVMKGKIAGRSHLVPVVGAIKRGADGMPSQARVRVIKNNRRSEVMPFVREHVKAKDAILYTDSLRSYEQHPTNPEFARKVIDHAVTYVQGDVHTNAAENFWSLVKRMLKGTYVSVEPFHLFRYLDEQVFRFNNRRLSDAQRFVLATASIFGRRVTFKELTGHAFSPSN